jgi:hypothetical protein
MTRRESLPLNHPEDRIQSPPPADHGRRILAVLVAWALVSVVLLGWLRVAGSNILPMELAGNAATFESELRHWQEPGEALCGIGARDDGQGPGYGTLRCQLFFDSVGLVPGYVGLLLLFSLGLGRGAGVRNAVARHLLCAPAVAAGLFDIAENSMTGRALEDYQRIVLADATVADVTHASLVKWALLALAFALLAVLAWATARRGLAARPRWLQVASVPALAAAALCAAGVATQQPGLMAWGMRAAIIALAVLAAWRWRSGPVPGPTSPRHSGA